MDNRRTKFVVEGIVTVAVVFSIVIFSSQRIGVPNGGVNGTAGANRLQAAFPSDIPLLTSGTVHSANATAPSGQFQVSHSFMSAKTTSASFTFYKQFLSQSSSSWIILSQRSSPADPAHRSILARNGEGILTVDISARPLSASLVLMMFVGNP